MKNKLFTFSFFCLLTNYNLQAQRHENIIKLGLIEPFYSSLGVAYERFIPQTTISLQAYGSITQRNVTIWESLKPNLKGFSAEIQGRYYYATKNRNTISGIYNGVFGKYGETQITMKVPDGVVRDHQRPLPGLDDRHEIDAAGRQAAFALEIRDQPVDGAQVRRRLDLGQHDAVHARPDDFDDGSR